MDRRGHLQAYNIKLRDWTTHHQQDLSLNSDAFPNGSYQQRTNDEHIVSLIREKFRSGANHLRSSFRCASRCPPVLPSRTSGLDTWYMIRCRFMGAGSCARATARTSQLPTSQPPCATSTWISVSVLCGESSVSMTRTRTACWTTASF